MSATRNARLRAEIFLEGEFSKSSVVGGNLQRVRIHLFTISERLHPSRFGVEAQNLLTAKKMNGYGIGAFLASFDDVLLQRDCGSVEMAMASKPTVCIKQCELSAG
jgi:hypothetical protein